MVAEKLIYRLKLANKWVAVLIGGLLLACAAFVLLDIVMPHMDGISALKQIKCRRFSPQVIMITGQQDVDNIVTEYGIARLRGKTCSERARELIAIAHPTYREQLEKEARAINILSKSGK